MLNHLILFRAASVPEPKSDLKWVSTKHGSIEPRDEVSPRLRLVVDNRPEDA